MKKEPPSAAFLPGNFLTRRLSMPAGKVPLVVLLSVIGLFVPAVILAQTPQGSLSANGPFCGSGAGMLTWSASAGTGPFTVVYNDGAANRTVTNVVSGTPFGVFTTPVTTNTAYNLVSVTGSDASIRTSGFTQATATINIKPRPDLSATPSSQTICSGSTFTTIELSSSFGGATFAWTRDNIAGVTGTGGVSAFSGTTNISGAFTNTSTAPAAVGFQVIPTFDGCPGAAKYVTVTVNPDPTVNPVANLVVCPGSNVAVSFNGTATSYKWTNINTSIGLAASGTGGIGSFVAVNPTASQKTATISVTPVYTNVVTCEGGSQSFTIAVNATAALTSSLTPAAACSGSPFIYVPSTDAVGLTPSFSWSRAEVAGVSNTAASGTGEINEVLINTTTSAKTVKYVVRVQATDGTRVCDNPVAYEVVVSVKPTPTVSFSPSSLNKTICSGSNIPQININNPNGIAGTTFSWTRTNGTLNGGKISGMPASGTGTPINGTLTNNGLLKDTSVFTVFANNNGCSSGASFNVIVAAPITDNKILGSQISNVAFCGLTRQVTIAGGLPKGGIGSFTYQWQVSSPGNNAFSNIPGATDSFLVYKTNNSAYFRRITYSAGCSDTSDIKSVTAGGGSTSTISKACTGGSGVDIWVTASYTGAIYTLQNDRTGVWVDVANQAPVTGTGTAVSFSNNKLTGNYRVSVKSGACIEYVSGTVEILANEIPEKPSEATATPSAICIGGSTNLVAIVPGASPANGAAVNWYTVPSGGEGISDIPVPSGQPFTVSPDTTTTYYAKSIFTVTGCKSSTRTAVKVVVSTTPVMTSVDSVGICSGGTVSIPLTDSLGAGTTYTWIAADNPNTTGESLSSQNSPTLSNSILNKTNTIQTVIYSVTPSNSGCVGTAQPVKVTVEPVTTVEPQAVMVCGGTGFELTPADGGGNIVMPGTTYAWEAPVGSGFAGGVPGSGSSITGVLRSTSASQAVATYSVTPSSGACTGTPFPVTVTLRPAAFISDQALSICSGSFALPPFAGDNVIPSGTTYSWAPPTGSNLSGIAGGHNQAAISGTLNNTSEPSVPVTATYTITPNSGDCEGPSFTLLVNLNFAPPADGAVWTGWLSGDWCNAANWACGVRPTSILNAIIPAGSVNQPNITGICNAAVRNIDIQGNATLNVGAGTNLSIYGSVVNTDPARYILSGTVTFAGGNQNVPGFTYSSLAITGGGVKTLLSPAMVTGDLDLNNGVIKTNNASMLTISASGTAGPGSTLSYVDGPLTHLTSSTNAYYFPVGGNGDVRPATITPESSVPSSYTVIYHKSPTGGNVPGPEPKAIQSGEYWEINRNSGSDAKFGIFYKNPNALPADALTGDWSNGVNPCGDCGVAVVWKDGSDNWQYTGTGGGFAPDQTTFWQQNTMVNSRGLLGNSGVFSFGYSSGTILAVQLISFSGIVQGTTSQLQWKFASGADVSSVEVQHSLDGRRFDKIGQVEASGKDVYEFVHPGIRPGGHFYRLLIKDKTGASSFSSTLLLISGKAITVIKGLRPTVIDNLAYADIHSASRQEVHLTIVDIAGRIISTQKGMIGEGENSFSLNTDSLLPGMYTVRIQTADGVLAVYKFIKGR